MVSDGHSAHEVFESSTTEGLPVAPALGPTLELAQVPPHTTLIDRRVVVICGIAFVLGIIGAVAAQVLTHLIGFITNLFFFGRISTELVSPAGHNLGVWVIGVPVVGALIIGFMARYGSKAIRGHGIPEAMEQVLTNESRIPARMTWLKPLSAAISIGTGGPFGAEGPIIATGGALGSLFGQVLRTTSAERKTLLAAGAAAGMAATFGAPVSAVLLAIELLLFEFRPRSFIPVAFAAAAGAGLRNVFEHAGPVFPMPDVAAAGEAALAVYIAIGAIIGVASVLVTRAVYSVEDAFEKLPIHWMWWPAIGAVAVGVVGYFVPRTLGVGYDNISDLISGNLTLTTIVVLCSMKFISWVIALGSGTSGGTMAPLFTVGGGLGALLGTLAVALLPGIGVDPRVAALVGMAAMFAGAARAMLTCAVLAFETTLQPLTLLPLLGGCSSAYLVSCLLMRQTIMTEKINRRGVKVPTEYHADVLDQLMVNAVATAKVVTISAGDTVEKLRTWMNSGTAEASHQGYPVIDERGMLVGVLTRRNVLDPAQPGERKAMELIRRPPSLVYDDCTLRQAMDHMVNHDIGRLPVVTRVGARLVGIITRSDLLSAYRRRLKERPPGD